MKPLKDNGLISALLFRALIWYAYLLSRSRYRIPTMRLDI